MSIPWRPILLALSLSLGLIGCKKPATDNTAAGPLKPTVDHQLAAKAALVMGDAAAAKAELQASIGSQEPMIGPVRLMGGWRGLEQLGQLPEGDGWQATVRQAIDSFAADDESAGHGLLEQAAAEAGDGTATPYVYLALSYLDSGRDTSGSGAIWRSRELADDGWLGQVAMMVIDSRAGLPTARQKTADVLENARFSPQRSAAANFYAARQAMIDGKPEVAEACLAVAMSVWGPQFQETKPPPAGDDDDDATAPTE